MKKVLITVCLTLPAFALMLRPGVWTMHDFHLFRQFEFNLCAREGSFPCRWAPHASLGFGQPLFNFYGQFPYWLGQLFITLGFPIIDSVKIVFLLSLLLSAVSMYLLASRFWGRPGGLISALFYVYAPYRAIDVWVRGALPESLAFIFFPLILLFLEQKKYLLFSLSLSLLLLTHNISLLIFAPFLFAWWLLRSRDWRFIPSSFLSLFLAAFYLLPVIFESRFITISQTVQGYYQFAHHFTTLKQLFISRLWGYGGSVWGPNDTMSFSTGHLHWILPGMMLLVLVIRQLRHPFRSFSLFIGLAILALFLTHGKSEFIWKTVPGLAYIQFPWRFLSMAALFLSLATGAVSQLTQNRLILSGTFTLLLLLNASFFRPDIWRSINDSQQFSGDLWREQISSALIDFWPASAPSVPTSPAPSSPQVVLGDAAIISQSPGTHRRTYRIDVLSDYAKISFPTVYFPGWTLLLNDVLHPVFPSGPLGLITTRIPQGRHHLEVVFRDTLPRTLGNITSGLVVLGVISWTILGRRRHA